MMFNGCYFHQIKGTAVGTPMVVSYANIFMSVFESNMLLEYQNKYNCKSTCWLRFIDDIFFIWTGNEKSLKHFLNFCNNYKNKGMEKNGTLSTTLFAKPAASCQYLHAKSSNPFHTMKALPKSQVVRICRIVLSHQTIGKMQIYS